MWVPMSPYPFFLRVPPPPSDGREDWRRLLSSSFFSARSRLRLLNERCSHRCGRIILSHTPLAPSCHTLPSHHSVTHFPPAFAKSKALHAPMCLNAYAYACFFLKYSFASARWQQIRALRFVVRGEDFPRIFFFFEILVCFGQMALHKTVVQH